MTRHPGTLATPRIGERRSFDRVIDGVSLHWVEYGRGVSRPAVVFLHGLNDSHLTWRQIAPRVARDHRVLALDLPGHGLSGRPDAPYDLTFYARTVAAWMDAVLGPSPVDIVGHSLGGGIALMLLRHCRPRIRRLVLAAPGGLGKEVAFVLRLALFPGAVERFGQPFMAMGTWLALRGLRAKLPRHHVREASAMNARPGTARAFARTIRDLADWRGQRYSFLRHAHEFDDLPPVTILWGERDAIIPGSHGKAMARQLEGVAFQELAGCGHHLHHDNPALFVQAVRDALGAPEASVTRGARDHVRSSRTAPQTRARRRSPSSSPSSQRG